MGESTVSRFFQKLGEDKVLAGEYTNAAVRAAVWPAIAEVAAKQGLAFSTAELEKWLKEKQGELSDEALEGIAAGALAPPQPPTGVGGWGGGGNLSWWVPAALGAVIVSGAVWDSGDDDDRRPISP